MKSRPAKISEYLTIGEAADLLGVNPMTLRRWDKAKKLRAIRHPISRYRLYLKRNLMGLLAKFGKRH